MSSDKVYVMGQERYKKLCKDVEEQGEFGDLTREELAQGYHYCDSFDGLLISPESQREYSCCTCNDDVCKEFARTARIAENQDRIKAIELRGAEIQASLRRKDLNEVVSDALIEEYHDLWTEYHDLKADQGYLYT